MKKKLYVCPQTGIQKVETGILCSSCPDPTIPPIEIGGGE